MITLAIVCEARADFETVSCLVDRCLTENIDWVEDSVLDSYRKWMADGSNQEFFYEWKSIKKLCRPLRIRVHGHFDGLPGHPDAVNGLRALRLILQESASPPSAILLIRDQDDQPERQNGLQQAVAAFNKNSSKWTVVIGFAVIERESWVLSGFVPSDQQESDLLKTVRHEVGFDPTTKPERLTAGKDDQALKSPKRVLEVLTAGIRHREHQCLEVTDVRVLKRNGTQNGLASLISDIETKIVPLLKS